MPEGRLDQWVIIRQSEIGSRQSVVGDYAQRQFFYFYFTLKITTNWGLRSTIRFLFFIRQSEIGAHQNVVGDYAQRWSVTPG
jgi:hypothetical protein